MTLNELIAARHLHMTVKSIGCNAFMEDAHSMDHWRCTIRNEAGTRIQVTFSQGRAWEGKEPELADVLDCLARDAASGTESFESFCSEMGFDPDSRHAERIWKACHKTADKLKRLMGADYEKLLYDMERL